MPETYDLHLTGIELFVLLDLLLRSSFSVAKELIEVDEIPPHLEGDVLRASLSLAGKVRAAVLGDVG